LRELIGVIRAIGGDSPLISTAAHFTRAKPRGIVFQWVTTVQDKQTRRWK
jgi:hypothetical protein